MKGVDVPQEVLEYSGGTHAGFQKYLDAGERERREAVTAAEAERQAAEQARLDQREAELEAERRQLARDDDFRGHYRMMPLASTIAAGLVVIAVTLIGLLTNGASLVGYGIACLCIGVFVMLFYGMAEAITLKFLDTAIENRRRPADDPYFPARTDRRDRWFGHFSTTAKLCGGGITLGFFGLFVVLHLVDPEKTKWIGAFFFSIFCGGVLAIPAAWIVEAVKRYWWLCKYGEWVHGDGTV